ncbi:ECF transporter S component [Halalkalibacter sp. APA_J-10(15)]|uniref:ECF transporter S component n=1 Tax=Halalkalibacter sp. APA_J-10(15) TaxID=2933805 RepID=UPI001FF10A33|nr:ECF transporter S component [Halalkalibacter sp. APA_J-10(15)]MCK0470571.1 ECF transporter S component [Halalkalibacter sp. APA_J-10(15)]
MENPRSILIVSSLMIVSLLFISVIVFDDKPYLMISMAIMVLTTIPLFARFELKQIQSKEIVFLAVLAAIAAISRVPFAPLPSVQPTSFVIIVSAIVLGPQAGFIIGASAAIVSNIFLGQGPWTPWQMFAWGMIGLVAGLLRNTAVMKNKYGLIGYGFIVGILFGWFMNLWFIMGFLGELTWPVFLSAYVASFYFDLAHGLSNVFFLFLFSATWIGILQRFKEKYGILREH